MSIEEQNKQSTAADNAVTPPAGNEPVAEHADSQAEENNDTVFDSIFNKKKNADGVPPADVVAEGGAAGADTAPAAEGAAAPAEPDYQAQLVEMTDRLMRSRAEFDNYRKRITREFGEVRDQAKQRTVGEFLSVYDIFILALSHMDSTSDLESMKQGMQLIFNEFQRTFVSLGVKEIDAVGQPFDARYHEAVAQEASDTVAEGTVIRQWKSGFQLGENLLRPATVVVSSGKPAVDAVGEAAGDAVSDGQ